MKSQPGLTEHGLPRVVDIGAEYCPYCAVLRWSLVAALLRFGTFTGLKETTSSADLAPVPSFSFLGSSYTSTYVAFTPYETEDRPATRCRPCRRTWTSSPPSTTTPWACRSRHRQPARQPWALRPSSSRRSTPLRSPPSPVPGTGDMQRSPRRSPTRPPPTAGPSTRSFHIETNFMTAAICRSDGGRPSAVFDSPGVRAAEKAIVAARRSPGLAETPDGSSRAPQGDAGGTATTAPPAAILPAGGCSPVAPGSGVGRVRLSVWRGARGCLSRRACRSPGLASPSISRSSSTRRPRAAVVSRHRPYQLRRRADEPGVVDSGIPVAVLGLVYFVAMLVSALPVFWRSRIPRSVAPARSRPRGRRDRVLSATPSTPSSTRSARSACGAPASTFPHVRYLRRRRDGVGRGDVVRPRLAPRRG